jgi:hypothetical protein
MGRIYRPSFVAVIVVTAIAGRWPHRCHSNTFLSKTLSCTASSAFNRIERLVSRSFAGVTVGFPTGCVMARPGTTREAPTMSAVGTRVVMIAVGMPSRSISWLIAAPQRVPVPHVAVNIPAETPVRFRSWAMFLPISRAVSTSMPTPVVV